MAFPTEPIIQTGPVVAPVTLPPLTSEQLQALQMAKKYCQDVTGKFVSLPSLPLTPFISLSLSLSLFLSLSLSLSLYRLLGPAAAE